MRLSITAAAQTKCYQDARARGVGVTDAIAGARWANALSVSVRDTLKAANKRSKSAKRGWKTRRAARA